MNPDADLQTQMERPRSSERYPATTIRLSLAFKRQIQEMAVANQMSMNAFIVLALDDYLVRMGRPSLAETDAAFIAFLRRERGSDRWTATSAVRPIPVVRSGMVETPEADIEPATRNSAERCSEF